MNKLYSSIDSDEYYSYFIRGSNRMTINDYDKREIKTLDFNDKEVNIIKSICKSKINMRDNDKGINIYNVGDRYVSNVCVFKIEDDWYLACCENNQEAEFFKCDQIDGFTSFLNEVIIPIIN